MSTDALGARRTADAVPEIRRISPELLAAPRAGGIPRSHSTSRLPMTERDRERALLLPGRRERACFSGPSRESRHRSRHRQGAVTVDCSQARTNLAVLRVCLADLGFKEVGPGCSSDIYWHAATFQDSPDSSTVNGKVNKFPGMTEMTRKVKLCQALSQMQQLYPEEFSFSPRAWFLPEQLPHFLSDCDRNYSHPRPTYIVKPNHGSQGDGIYLIQDGAGIREPHKQQVIQEYLPAPLLLRSYKFDLRIYAVLTSLDPLQVHICKEGMVRLCTVPYHRPAPANLNTQHMHLTNYSLNKQHQDYQRSTDHGQGSKRLLTSVFSQLERQSQGRHDTCRLWGDIERLVVKTLLAILPELRVHYQAEIPSNRQGPTCFQILGFDILILDDLSPVLLEVNNSPSMRIDYETEDEDGEVWIQISSVDEEIKRPLVRDTLRLVAPARKLARMQSDVNANIESPGSSSLKEIYPAKYALEYENMRVLERLQQLFQYFINNTRSTTMGLSGFKSFIRRCKLSTDFLNSSDVETMYTELQEKVNLHSETTGLTLGGFTEAFIYFSKRRYPDEDHLCEAVERLMNYCDVQLSYHGRRPSGRLHTYLPLLPRLLDNSKKLDLLRGVCSAQAAPMHRDSSVRERRSENEMREEQKINELKNLYMNKLGRRSSGVGSGSASTTQ